MLSYGRGSGSSSRARRSIPVDEGETVRFDIQRGSGEVRGAFFLAQHAEADPVVHLAQPPGDLHRAARNEAAKSARSVSTSANVVEIVVSVIGSPRTSRTFDMPIGQLAPASRESAEADLHGGASRLELGSGDRNRDDGVGRRAHRVASMRPPRSFPRAARRRAR